MRHSLAAAAVVVLLYCGYVICDPLLGTKECTWGPSYWCSNITNAKGCGAVHHCIKSVWEKQHVPVDDDEVCKICTDMVKQARDQLESNETQQDLRDVFEGSCKLIPLKIVAKECIKLADDFIPELVETLASQMNPQVVCTVAGLCNSERIDIMLDEMKNKGKVDESDQMCGGCHSVVGKMRNKFDDMTYEKFLEKLLRTCGKLGSFSDSCATAVFTHFEDIYSHVKDNFNADNVCHVLGTCTARFHVHAPEDATKVEITPMGNVGRLDVDQDLPCELCEKLVLHARDIIIANTTEEEFKQVLVGICKQTGSFSNECLDIVNQYYPIMYEFLVKELDPNAVCFMMGVCHKGAKDVQGPIAPLVPLRTAEIAVRIMQKPSEKLIGNDERKSYPQKPVEKNQESVKILQPELSQLPIDRMFIQMPENAEACRFCEYFLHFVQEQISDDKNEEKIKQVVEKACKILPNSVDVQCESFVTAYGDAAIAMLAQEIDPSIICPELAICPKQAEVKMDVLMSTGGESKANCPLCLLAVEQLETMLKDNHTKENIKEALDKLCGYLSKKLQPECIDFVDTYSKQLVEMLSAQFTPQEVCVFLKICTDNRPDTSMIQETSSFDDFHTNKMLMADRNRFKKPILPAHMLANGNVQEKNQQIETNIIPDNTYNGKVTLYDTSVNVKATPQCVLCEFIMTEIDKELSDKHNDDEIKKIVNNICNLMPKSIRTDCHKFVNQYVDVIVELLVHDLSPKEICTTMQMCLAKTIELQGSVTECAVCHQLIDIVDHMLNNPNVDRKLEHIIEKSCRVLPQKYTDTCHTIMETYGDSFIHLVVHLADNSKVCSELGLCGSSKLTFVKLNSREKRTAQKLVGAKKCTWGPSYWCENEANAMECSATKHCQERVWLAEKPNSA